MDRRKYPRTQGNIPVKIYSDDFDVVTETKNLSRAGVYCQVDKYIEPMTKLNIHLLLSSKKRGEDANKENFLSRCYCPDGICPRHGYF